ncbi:MAG: EAL domain-containing protein [Chlorogloea purpurea SAG 13.99]|nr:EAL domain-containing protein [Chlorogloea purpurea SAG 13.99]
MEVIAEGVETWEHLQCLKAIGCQTARGYYFSKPIKAWQMDELLNQFVHETGP